MAVTSKKDQLIDTALRLFSQAGFHATGVDKILEDAGVARMTLYHHFGSKQDLIVAALERKSLQSLDFYRSKLTSNTDNPRYDALQMFDVLHERFSQHPDQLHWGCVLINALAEFNDPNDAIRQVAVQHDQELRSIFRNLLERSELAGIDALADRLKLIYDGAIISSQITNSPQPAREAAVVARALIDQSSMTKMTNG